MKKLLLLIASTLAMAASMPAAAITANGAVPISITLTPLCVVTAPAAVTMTYTSFDTGAASNAQTGQVKCTNLRTYRIAFSSTDNTVLTASGTGVGLNYTLTLSGNGAGANSTRSGVDQSYTVTGGIAAGQAGDCASGASCTYTNATAATMYVIY